jgi:hypothetical protein
MDNKGNLLREGSGDYTCFPYEGGSTATMCADAEWLAWNDASMMQQTDYVTSGFGLAYMLAGDPPEDGASTIDPFATAPTPDNQWIVEGSHVMILVPDPSAARGRRDRPRCRRAVCDVEGHVMMPTGPRPQ